MTISLEILVGILVSIITITTFLIARMKDAEGRGRMIERVEGLEKQVIEIMHRHRTYDDKIGVHESDIVALTGKIEGLQGFMERIEKKLDKVLERSQI